MHLHEDVIGAGGRLDDLDDADVGGTGGLEDLDGAHAPILPGREPPPRGARPSTMSRLLLLPFLGLLLSACGHTSSPAVPACCAPADDASVAGVLVGSGGPVGAGRRHWAGTISTSGPWFTSVETDARGRFTLRLPHGVYRFTATSPQYDDGHGACTSLHQVRVRAHRTTHVRVVCQLR